MEEKIKCTCKWTSCKRYGKCEECIEHHKNHSKYPVPFCMKNKTVAKSASKCGKVVEE